jgi:tetraacyldisaccharide 4'-kinase
MPPSAPDFWKRKDSVLSLILMPFSLIYTAASHIKSAFTKPYQSRLPVLCVGNAVLGGSGKTPVVHALLPLLTEAGFERPVILLRGYGGTLKGPTFVDPAVHTAKDTGDEALLHAQYAPTIISADRAAGARLAELSDADIIIMDDGLQNNGLKKNLCVLVHNFETRTGNGLIFPAGPLREPLETAARKCAFAIAFNLKDISKFPIPVFHAETFVVSEHDKTKTYNAFAGIGHPDKFHQTLLENGFQINEFFSFPDHHPYQEEEISSLLAKGLPLLTTSKDFVRIREKANIAPVEIALKLDGAEDIVQILRDGLRRS